MRGDERMEATNSSSPINYLEYIYCLTINSQSAGPVRVHHAIMGCPRILVPGREVIRQGQQVKVKPRRRYCKEISVFSHFFLYESEFLLFVQRQISNPFTGKPFSRGYNSVNNNYLSIISKLYFQYCTCS